MCQERKNEQDRPIKESANRAKAMAERTREELRKLSKKLDRLPRGSRRQKNTLRSMELRLEELKLYNRQMSAFVGKERSRLEEISRQLDVVKRVWQPIQTIHGFLMKLHFTSWFGSLADRTIRISMYLAAFYLTIATDVLTGPVEQLVKHFDKANYHIETVSLMFIAQLFVFDLCASRFSTILYAKLLRWVTSSIPKTLSDIDRTEKQLEDVRRVAQVIAAE